MIRKAALIMIFFCFGCDSQSQDFRIYKKDEVLPEIITEDRFHVTAVRFCDLFKKSTGYRPLIKSGESPDSKAIITFGINKAKAKDNFGIYNRENKLIIEGGSDEALEKAIRYFFSAYVGYITSEIYRTGIETINVPSALAYEWNPSFEYREPYFRDNFKKEFREWNNTQTLEETWGLWGHNITKAVKATPAMMAKVDGKINDEQYCFSSPELENALIEFIGNNGGEKFMIMPNDNDVVCICDRCKKLGNTKTNASPAVFTLLNRLAAKFPKQDFFSTAYITTQMPPTFSMAGNTGVMISTMAFPKGVIVETSRKKELVGKTFSGWKKATNTIYLWDYAVNYNNYFDAYPTVSIAQQNLKYYKNLGVTGVFMHGSEENYSVFDDLKCYLYAQLLQNVNIDIKEYTERFFLTEYPQTGSLLYEYYIGIEQNALASLKELDIYGGIGQAKKKYLNEDKLTTFYDSLSKKSQTCSATETAALKPILASLAFNKLELLRTKGLEGYNDPTAKEYARKLWLFCEAADIDIYNEMNSTVTEYLSQWDSEIFNRPYKNLLYGKPIRFTATPDEDYDEPKMLNDGSVGFNDYYNNWVISTGDILSIEISANDVKGANVIEMDFLSDNRHNIYLPKKVAVTIGGRNYEKEIPQLNSKIVSKYRVSIPVEIHPEDKIITVQAIKQDDYTKRSTACDEIFFK